MKKILVLLIGILILLVIPLAYSRVVSDDYSVDSYHTGLAAGNSSNLEYSSRFTFTYQQGSSDIESLDYDANIGWFSQPSFCGDGTCDDDEDCSSCSSDCACASGYTCSAGICTAVTPEEPEVPGVGGGAACTYEWVCSDWYPKPCPVNGIQNRVCVNRGTCSGVTGMPSLNRTCTPVIVPTIEPLFDLFAKVPFEYKWINPGDSIKIEIKLINLGNTTALDVFFKYWIVDENNTLITEMQETRAISERDTFKIEMALPPEIELGIYKYYVQITYDIDKVAVAVDSFEVVKSKIDKFIWMSFLMLISFLMIGFLIFLIRRWRGKRKKKKKTEKSLRDYKKRVRKAIERHKNKSNL